MSEGKGKMGDGAEAANVNALSVSTFRGRNKRIQYLWRIQNIEMLYSFHLETAYFVAAVHLLLFFVVAFVLFSLALLTPSQPASFRDSVYNCSASLNFKDTAIYYTTQ